MATQLSYLYKCCPACGGRARAEARLPLAHASRPEEFNLDNLGALVEKQTIGFLLALVELLPYKIFTCRKCGHEFQMQNRAAKDLVHSMLAAMQPVAAAPAPDKRRVTVRLPTPAVAPVRAEAGGADAMPSPPPVQRQPAAPHRQPAAADWEPYHLDGDKDPLFDQFKAR